LTSLIYRKTLKYYKKLSVPLFN